MSRYSSQAPPPRAWDGERTSWSDWDHPIYGSPNQDDPPTADEVRAYYAALRRCEQCRDRFTPKGDETICWLCDRPKAGAE